MLRTPCYVISDTHLGVATEGTEVMLRTFLRSLQDRAGSVVINGDLYDFWFEWRHVIPRRSFRVLAALADLTDCGLPVLWIAGNHDCWGGEVLRKDIGVEYILGAWEGEVGGWRTRIEHGDGLREVEDRKYRRLRTVLRHPLSIRAFRVLHPDLGSRLALGSSHASRSYRARDEGEGLRRVATAALEADPGLDLLIYGHSHVATLEKTARGGIYANAGSWLDAPTFLRIDDDRVELRRWDGSAEGVCLDSLDARAKEALGQREKVIGSITRDEPVLRWLSGGSGEQP